MAIFFNGELQSAPVIREAITGGRAQISGGENGFVYQEDIDAWKQLFRLMGKNGRDFFNDTAIYDAIAASSPSEIACSYIMNAEIFFMKPDYMDAVKDFFRQRPEFVQRYSLCVHDDHFTYKLKWVVNRIVK